MLSLVAFVFTGGSAYRNRPVIIPSPAGLAFTDGSARSPPPGIVTRAPGSVKKMLPAKPLIRPFLLHERNTLFEGTG